MNEIILLLGLLIMVVYIAMVCAKNINQELIEEANKLLSQKEVSGGGEIETSVNNFPEAVNNFPEERVF
jgi:hypothetical protein